MLRPPHPFLARVNDGFRKTAVARGLLLQTEVDAWLEDIVQLEKDKILTNGIVPFTVAGEKAV